MSPDEAACPDAATITVKRALRLPALRVGAPEVVAGARHLSRPIRWAHSGEVPNLPQLLKGGELVLTTGMGIGATADAQRRFIDELADRDVAGVVIELGGALRRLPGPLLEEAERRDLPLVVLHHEVRFVEVTETIHSEIVNHQLALLRRGNQMHQRFTELMLDGAGVAQILDALASTVANPVVLERAGQGLLYHATHRAPAPEVLAAWEGVRFELERGHDDHGTTVVPVPGPGHVAWGRLAALPLDSPLDDFDRVAVGRAAEVVALALLRARQEELLAAHQRGGFLDEVAAGRIGARDAEHEANVLGFSHTGPLVPLALVDTRSPAPDQAAWTPVWRALREAPDASERAILVGACGGPGDALVVLGVASADERSGVVEALVRRLHAAVARHVGPADRLTVAAGAAVAGWAELPEALREARETAEVARMASWRSWHDASGADVETLLAALRGDPRVQRFVKRRLAPLLEYDARRATKLLPTLAELFAHAGRKAETARALHLERQSLYHRLQRIEQLLGVRLDDPSARLGLELALRVHHQQEGATTSPAAHAHRLGDTGQA